MKHFREGKEETLFYTEEMMKSDQETNSIFLFLSHLLCVCVCIHVRVYFKAVTLRKKWKNIVLPSKVGETFAEQTAAGVVVKNLLIFSS